ncbi:hypothetical protein B0H14DRAFT_514110 [Mycena olivaceomarginata]|nr:hypothetical protein B0H14DRAFT_514110 [Mycena olivaceomarginata]
MIAVCALLNLPSGRRPSTAYRSPPTKKVVLLPGIGGMGMAGTKGWTSDSGWGCILRTSQSLFATALGRGCVFPSSSCSIFFFFLSCRPTTWFFFSSSSLFASFCVSFVATALFLSLLPSSALPVVSLRPHLSFRPLLAPRRLRASHFFRHVLDNGCS